MHKKFLKFKKRFVIRHKRRMKRFKTFARHPLMIPILTFLFLFLISGLVYFFIIRNPHPGPPLKQEIVIISYDHKQQIVPSHEATVGALLNKLHIKLHQGDVVEPALSTPIQQDQFRINIYRAVPVQIVGSTHITYTYSAATTPRSIVEQAGIKLYPQDNVKTVPAENFLRTRSIGEQVIINRATPVSVNLYGNQLTLRTHAKTVSGLLKQSNIHLAPTDHVLPSLTAAITPGEQIFVVRHGTKISSVTQPIAMPIQTIPDASLAFGTSAVRQQGSPGTEVITYQDNLRNGVVVSKTAIQTVITQPPVTEIVVEGTSLSGVQGDMALAGIPPRDYQYVNYIVSHESGWCPTKAQGETYCPAVPVDPYTSGGYGLCQATPGDKMASAGADWQTNPITQLEWCNSYAHSSYGSWYNAYIHWINYTWW